MGSPLALRTIRKRVPQPFRRPAFVAEWRNYYAATDLVAGGQGLPLDGLTYTHNHRRRGIPFPYHLAEDYLDHAPLAENLAAVLALRRTAETGGTTETTSAFGKAFPIFGCHSSPDDGSGDPSDSLFRPAAACLDGACRAGRRRVGVGGDAPHRPVAVPCGKRDRGKRRQPCGPAFFLHRRADRLSAWQPVAARRPQPLAGRPARRGAYDPSFALRPAGGRPFLCRRAGALDAGAPGRFRLALARDRKSTRLNSSH